jgi:hypothetical protein
LVVVLVELVRGFPFPALAAPVATFGIGFLGGTAPIAFQHCHALRDLLIRLLGSLAVLAEVSFFFIPDILAQNDFLRGPPSGCGALSPGFPGLALL